MSRQNLMFTLLWLTFAYIANVEASTPVKGYVLTHEHPAYGMAFGGNYAFAGAPGNFINGVMEKGYTANCGGCKVLGNCDHGEVKGSFTAALGKPLGRDMGDHNSYMGPLHDSNSHLRYSSEWVHEAFAPSEAEFQDTSMKIMVALAVENEAMCEQLYYANKGNGGPGGNGYACSKGDSIKSLERQLDSIKAWVDRNKSWMQIAYSAAQARQIVDSNKLAIVLGVEADYAFGAEDRSFDPVNRLNRYFDQGVRTFYLAHKINSRLSGADIYLPSDSKAGKAVRATQAISGCFYYDDNVGRFPLEGRLGKNLCDNNCRKNAFKGGKITDKCVYKFSDISEVNFADYVLTRGAGAFNGFSLYPKPPGFSGKGGSTVINGVERNNLGLSHDGERVVREAMLKGMIVNLDHISSQSRDKIYDIATKAFGGYPLNALHNNPNARLGGENKPHEYDFDTDELEYIKTTGGIFGVRVGPLDSKEYPESGITANCPKTSTETAKILAWLIDRKVNIAGYSLDYSTITEGVHSRTMYSCGLELGDDRIHKYDRHDAQGLSHVGMMKKWHKELETIGLKKRYLNKLKNNGAEAFLQMWQRSEAKSANGAQIPRQTFTSKNTDPESCSKDSDCANNQYCGDPVVGARTCKTLKVRGQACTAASQCATGRCSWGICADADECRADKDCKSNQYCGDPISGKRKCKSLLTKGKVCTKDIQCASNKCSLLRCK